MEDVVRLNLWQFCLIYLLLVIVTIIMKVAKIKQMRLLLVASARMTVQLVIAGLILTYIFENRHPLFTVAYIVAMITFAIYRVLHKCKALNKKFKWIVAGSLTISGLFVLCFFIIAVVGENIFNPQYTIPIGGMIIGNSMTGIILGLSTFTQTIRDQRPKIDALINLGVHPKKVLLPFANAALETALLPTLNTMLGLGIISLPGMMTGQILSGTLPMTAIMYQIAIMIAICTAVCLTTFCALYFGYQTLYNSEMQISF